MKRHTIICILIFLCVTSLPAQENVQTNALRSGDYLERWHIVTDMPSERGRGVVWDISGMEVLDKHQRTGYYAVADSLHPQRMAEMSRENRLYLDSSGDTIIIGGLENRSTRLEYDEKEAWLWMPLHYGDSISGCFSGRGCYCDKQLVRQYGLYKTMVDGTGCLLLPEGDTLRHVLRLTTERLMATHYLKREEDLKRDSDIWAALPAYNADSVMQHMASDSLLQHTVIRRWYAAGYRYPVLETQTISMVTGIGDPALQELSTVCYYFPPTAQETELAYDPENRLIRDLIARGEYCTDVEQANDAGKGQPSVIQYSMTQDKGAGTLTFHYDLTADTTVRIVLSNSMGIAYRTASQTNTAGEGYTLTLNYNGLPRGQYVAYISVGGQTYTEKFSINP